jgi:hypothetical protein
MEKCETNVLRVSFLLFVEHICLISRFSQIWMFTSTSVTSRETNVLRDKCAPTYLGLLRRVPIFGRRIARDLYIKYSYVL